VEAGNRYSGFEIASKALMMDKWKRQVEKEMYERLLEKCVLPDYEPIEPPTDKPKLAKWLNKEEGSISRIPGSNFRRSESDRSVAGSIPICRFLV
jgi:hypothetical protein